MQLFCHPGRVAGGAALILAVAACGPPSSDAAEARISARVRAACPHDDPSIVLPRGFCAQVFADHVGGARDIAVASNGDVFVRVVGSRSDAYRGIVALRDVNHDGVADTTATFGELGGTGIALYHGYLYSDDRTSIGRWPLPEGSLLPSGPEQVVVADLPTGGHEARNFAIDSSGALFLNVGSLTNSCQVQDRQTGSPGKDPCPELATRAGIWKFDASRLRQTQRTAEHYATGIRNAMGLALDPRTGGLYATQHGRDQLFQNWPKLFDAVYGAENPAEELVRVHAHDDFGWPYCYYAMPAKRLVLAPEYGGNGTTVGRCASKAEPIVAFPGHWAPMSLLFYDGTQFPAHYHGGAFIAFHGSWNRAPEPQAGYRVVFVPMRDGVPSGPYETFANGFAGEDVSPAGAAHRPTGLAVGPDGALYVTDDRRGRIWKIRWVGD